MAVQLCGTLEERCCGWLLQHFAGVLDVSPHLCVDGRKLSAVYLYRKIIVLGSADREQHKE
jgi:hypothetical protein